ncbi:hypothetical protein HHI36_007701 [Cryptolaemus montrouzieri]|uniref:Uncharacterized protein n=1 Tax=Cryptolaemus montrouzieri TaxID=559131 RepID=A0ABD2MQB6_9CUCU
MAYECQVCDIKCKTGSISCNSCKLRWHTKFLTMPVSRLNYYANQAKSGDGDKWICIKCEAMNSKDENVILQEEMQEIKNSLQFISNAFDEQNTKIEKLSDEMKFTKRENELLKEKIKNIEFKMNISEQKKKNNLVVTGIPDQKDNDKKVITKILDTLKVPHENDDEIKEVFRMGKKQ